MSKAPNREPDSRPRDPLLLEAWKAGGWATATSKSEIADDLRRLRNCITKGNDQ